MAAPPAAANVVRTDRPEPGVPAVVVTDQKSDRTERAVVYRPPSLLVGVGASRGAPAAEIGQLIDDTLAELGLSPRSVRRSRHRGPEGGPSPACWPRRPDGAGPWSPSRPAWPAAVPVPNPSEVVRRAVGTPSVAEAAALIEAGSVLLAAKRASVHATVAVARRAGRGAGWR